LTDPLFQVEGLCQSFDAPGGLGALRVLDGLELSLEHGEFVLLRGPSGSGKSTLLQLLGGLRRPTEGSLRFEGEELFELTEARRRRLRAGPIGFVFQEMHLLPYLSARANVALALGRTPRREALQRADEVLGSLGLNERRMHRPGQLSAGERQRVAVARALVREPRVILADEPTGSLDPENAAQVLGLLGDYHSAGGTVLMVTHASELAMQSHTRELHLCNGRV
jgi:putative ABC transport system ATP-binding protein